MIGHVPPWQIKTWANSRTLPNISHSPSNWQINGFYHTAMSNISEEDPFLDMPCDLLGQSKINSSFDALLSDKIWIYDL